MYPSRSTRLWFCIAVVGALIALWPRTTQTFKEVEPGSDPEWAPVTLIAGQNARLNLANISDDDPVYTPGDCQVEVSFLNAAGQLVENPTTLEIRPSESVTVTGPTPHMREGERTQLVRPVVRFVRAPDFRTLARVRQSCTVVPVMEVFSEDTGATLFQSPAVIKGFNPQPDPPGHQLQGR